MPTSLPFAIREALIGNVVVGNYSAESAITLSSIIAIKLLTLSQNVV